MCAMVMASPLKKLHVVLADNDEKLIGIIKGILLSFGFRDIDVALNGQEAIELLNKSRSDLVICDWEMQPMKGIELVHYIRHHPHSPDPFIPIIMLTGRAEMLDVIAARDEGITEFIAKPFTVEDLRERIIEIIERPRKFILHDTYKGPDRRRHKGSAPSGKDRRHQKQ